MTSARAANASVSRSSFLTMVRTILSSREELPERSRTEHRRRTGMISAVASGEDLDPFECGCREGRPALCAGVAIEGRSRVAIRAGHPDRPAAREQEADVGGEAEGQHEDRPGDLLA